MRLVPAGLLAMLLTLALAGPARAAGADAWVTRALVLQHELAGDVGLANAPTVGTHNSFNAPATVGPTLSAQDANQKIALVDQLDLGVRSLELDLHVFPSASGGGIVPVVCHSQPMGVGCSAEPPLAPVIAPVAAWLKAHPGQVILLYLEDDLGSEANHDAAAATLEQQLGPLVYRTPADRPQPCAKLPLALTRDAVRAAGKQVVIVGNCAVGKAYTDLAFDWGGHFEDRPIGFTPFPACGPKPTREVYDTQLVRFYEDSTMLNRGAAVVGATEVDDGLTPATVTAMTHCGVDLFGLDQLVPGDPRLESMVWSWARGEPQASGDCAIQRVGPEAPDGRWYVRGCASRRHRVACRTTAGAWTLTRHGVKATKAPRACAKLGAVWAAPRTGYEEQGLRGAMDQAGTGAVWLGLRRIAGTPDTWRGTDPR